MKKKLLPYQVIGAKFLSQNPFALLADEPGLGKTIQAIAAARAVGAKRVLVVCPASVRLGWKQELEETLGSTEGWDVISYNTATTYRMKGIKLDEKFDLVILDEVHFCKTANSQRTQAVFASKTGLIHHARRVWGLSGTPVLNRPVELWPMLKTLHPVFAPMSYTSYINKYCGAYFDGYTINAKGATNLAELSGHLQTFMLRRTKAEVLPQLPPKRVSRVPLDVRPEEFAAVYAEEALIGNREARISSVHEDFSQLGDMAKLLRLTGEAKVRATVSFLSDLLETENKVVVFARHRGVIAALAAGLAAKKITSVSYVGGMSDDKKGEAVKEFQG